MILPLKSSSDFLQIPSSDFLQISPPSSAIVKTGELEAETLLHFWIPCIFRPDFIILPYRLRLAIDFIRSGAITSWVAIELGVTGKSNFVCSSNYILIAGIEW